jgi:Glutathione S-transferase, N-terminal domain
MAETPTSQTDVAETPTPQAETPTPQQAMAAKPTLYVCHGDEGGPRMHPCSRVQKALRDAGIEYEKVIAAKGSPIPFLRKGSREELRAATGDTKLPTLKLPDGTVITHSRAILAWIDQQQK